MVRDTTLDLKNCRWTKVEDKALKAAVARYGTKNNWKIIATLLPGRSNKSCRKRWVHSLDPSLQRGRWSTDEDIQLREAVKRHGYTWWKVAKDVPGRTDDQCAKRWKEKLCPTISTLPWSAAEDTLLLDLYKAHKSQWHVIANSLPGRPAVVCRNRYNRLMKAQRTSEQQATQGTEEMAMPLSSPSSVVSGFESDSGPSSYQTHDTSMSVPESDPFASFTQYPTDVSSLLFSTQPSVDPNTTVDIMPSPTSTLFSNPSDSSQMFNDKNLTPSSTAVTLPPAGDDWSMFYPPVYGCWPDHNTPSDVGTHCSSSFQEIVSLSNTPDNATHSQTSVSCPTHNCAFHTGELVLLWAHIALAHLQTSLNRQDREGVERMVGKWTLSRFDS